MREKLKSTAGTKSSVSKIQFNEHLVLNNPFLFPTLEQSWVLWAHRIYLC